MIRRSPRGALALASVVLLIVLGAACGSAETGLDHLAPGGTAPQDDGWVALADGERPEPGRRYGVPLHIHCGMDWLYVGSEPWRRTDGGPDTETGAGDQVPEDWPVAQQTIFGFATLVEDDLIEYSIGDDEVIATYALATTDPPGCD
jgi:hypothetical protein